MRCPSCSQDGFRSSAVCTNCGFGGAPRQVEELAHITYLLGELETYVPPGNGRPAYPDRSGAGVTEEDK